LESRHGIWTPPINIWYTMESNFPEITQKMVEDSCESLTKNNLVEKTDGLAGGFAYRRTRAWVALGLPKRDRYGNIGEDD
jgi:hypothetical protein